MTKTVRKALSLVLAIAIGFTLTMVFTMTLTAYAAIGVDQAKEIALNDAGLTAADVIFTEARADGREFDVEFRSGITEYDYSISNEGEILSFSYDSNTYVTGARTLDTEDAKTAALALIGVDAADVKGLRAEYDDNEYEVSFTCGDKEYDVTVSAVDGTVIEYDYETVETGGFMASISAFFQRLLDFFKSFLG